jgi:8-oxo-dGTP diphosphatase
LSHVELSIDFNVASWYFLTDLNSNTNGDLVMRQFGTEEPGHSYPARLSAYALLFDDDTRLLVVKHRGLLFLPGGGVDDGESFEEALQREMREEVGWSVEIDRKICEAGQYTFIPQTGTCVNKIGYFFLVKSIDRSRRGTERDHQPMWVTIAEFSENAAHESHLWAAELALSGGY